MNNRMIVTMEDIKRYNVMQEINEGKLKLKDAEQILGLSYRQVLRIYERFQDQGLEGLLRKQREYPPNKKITDHMERQIISLRREKFKEFNIQHFLEYLQEQYFINLSHETLRLLLIKHGEHIPKQKKKTYRRRRKRMPKAGMMLQMDSSQHRWIKHVEEKWWLIAMIDDATSEVPFAMFFSSDNTFNNMHVIKKCLESKGLFMSLYVDKASHFTTTRKGGTHIDTGYECDETQIERALAELDITMINAHSPQAKGRVERLFGTFQDRLINELELEGISDYDAANEYLWNIFIPKYNDKFSIAAELAYRTLPSSIDLDEIFSIQRLRKVQKDHTVQFLGHTFQLPPNRHKLSLSGHTVIVCLTPDDTVTIKYNNQVLLRDCLSETNKTKKKKKSEKLLSKREYVPVEVKRKPAPDHPWRKFVLNPERKGLVAAQSR